MKIGYTFAYHHSEKIRPHGQQMTSVGINSFYESCNYDFETFVIDNQSEPRESFSEIFDLNTKNLHYTYIENQFEKGITGAWDLGIRQAIESGCDIVILTNDDIVYDESVNDLIKYIIDDNESDNSVYGPVASGITNPIQIAEKPDGVMRHVLGSRFLQHLGGHAYFFTKELYDRYKQPSGELFIIDQHHNGGDGKWGGNEGNVMCWAELGCRCIVAGNCHVIQQVNDKQSWKRPRDEERGKSWE